MSLFAHNRHSHWNRSFNFQTLDVGRSIERLLTASPDPPYYDYWSVANLTVFPVDNATAPMAAVEIGIILGRVAVCAATHPLSPIIAAGVGRACH